MLTFPGVALVTLGGLLLFMVALGSLLLSTLCSKLLLAPVEGAFIDVFALFAYAVTGALPRALPGLLVSFLAESSMLLSAIDFLMSWVMERGLLA